jgi:hypothetical protein
MAITTTAVHADVGELWDGISGTTTTICERLITKAEATIVDVTGTTTNFDRAVRSLADYFVCQHILGGRDYVSINVGGVSLSEKRLVEMRDDFFKEAERSLRIKGYNLDGNVVRWTAVNQ